MRPKSEKKRRVKVGTVCMTAGAALVVAALCLFGFNQWEDRQAGLSVAEVLPQVMEIAQQDAEAEETGGTPVVSEASGTDMTEVMVEGYDYIGYLSIPSLSLELPVMSTWSYPQLRIAPCRYYGSTKTGDLVIAAHNYSRHFGNLKDLSVGDKLYFTDMDGTVTTYEVVELDNLAPTAIEEMTSGGYALTLFTCTYSGQSRVTVCCDACADS